MPTMNVVSPRCICRSPQGLVTKSWRQDQEVVSAAFSKWVRVVMLHDDETERESIRKRELEELQRLLDEEGRHEINEIRK